MKRCLICIPFDYGSMDLAEIKEELRSQGEELSLMLSKCLELLNSDWEEQSDIEKLSIIESFQDEEFEDWLQAAMMLVPVMERINRYLKVFFAELGDVSNCKFNLYRLNDHAIVLEKKEVDENENMA